MNQLTVQLRDIPGLSGWANVIIRILIIERGKAGRGVRVMQCDKAITASLKIEEVTGVRVGGWPLETQRVKGIFLPKESACQSRRHRRCGFNPWVGMIPWRRRQQPTAVCLPGMFHEQRSRVSHDVAKSQTRLSV